MKIGDATVIFWTGRESEAENIFAGLFDTDIDLDQTDAEDADSLHKLRIILKAARNGRLAEEIEEPDVPFYLLALSPNAARLSVRFWLVSTVREVIQNLEKHYKRLEIVKNFDSDLSHPSPRTLLRETVSHKDPGKSWEKDEKVSPVLAGAFLRSILGGGRYPEDLLPMLLMRIGADQTMNYLRAAMIKAFLIRNHNKEVSVSLDESNTKIGYRLGRLFAVFERIQASANPSISSTIRDKYFGSAAATPRNIYPVLWGLSQQHIGKMRKDVEKQGYARFLDAKVEEIASAIGAEPLPAFLSPEDQGLFYLGYYHQRKDLFTKKSQTENNRAATKAAEEE